MKQSTLVSLTLPKSWKRGQSTGSNSGAGEAMVASGSAAPKPAADLGDVLQKFHEEEDRLLGEFEAIRMTVQSPEPEILSRDDANTEDLSVANSSLLSPDPSTGGGGRGGMGRSRSRGRLPSSCASPQNDLLGSFCHLMNYVVHLRRDNRHLRKQVACLTEMRKIEQLKSELLLASCSCQPHSSSTAAPTDPPPAAFCDESKSRLPTEEGLGKETKENVKNDLAKTKDKLPQSDAADPSDSASERYSHHHPPEENNSKTLPTACGGEKTKEKPLRPLSANSELASTALGSITSKLASSATASNSLAPTGSCRSLSIERRENSSIMKQSRSPPPPPLPLRPPPRGIPAFQAQRTVIKDGAQESLATPPPTQKTFPTDPMGGNADSMPPPLPPRNRFGFAAAMALPKKPQDASDSDADQPVFSEVSLPAYEPQSPKRRSIRRTRETSGTASPTDPYVQMKFAHYHPVRLQPKPVVPLQPASGPTGSKSSILEKLGIRKRSSDKKEKLSESMYSRSSSISRLGSEFGSSTLTRISTEGIGSVVKKAMIKKRKRKISESDSLASSEASGKPYVMMDLPDRPASQHTHSQLTAETLQSNLSPDQIKKIQEWEAHKRDISQKGQYIKKSWLKKPKQQRIESTGSPELRPGSSGLRYFERSVEEQRSSQAPAGRQDTVIFREIEDIQTPPLVVAQGVNHAASDSNIKDLEGDRELLKKLKKSENASPKIGHKSGSRGKSRSVTVHEEMEDKDRLRPPSSFGDSGSLNYSADSVFTSQEILEECGTSGLIDHLVSLQEKNSVLLRRLREKSKEYEQITDQLGDLEREVRLLKGKYKFDEALEKFEAQKSAKLVVPESMVADLEGKLKEMDETLRTFKNESFRTQQEILESYVKEQSSNQNSLDHIERLQKTNFMLLQRQMSELSIYDTEIRRRLELMPTYDALYSFTINLIRKLRHLRSQILDKAAGTTRLDFELLQTQSSLLLAHAQIERQKLELRAMGAKFPKRPHSFHGLEWLDRFVKEDLSFYLPFKLHGSRISKSGEQLTSLKDEETLEDEFLRLFDYARRTSAISDLPVRDLPMPSAPQYQAQRPLAYHSTRLPMPGVQQQRFFGGGPIVSSGYMLPSIRQNIVCDWPAESRRPMSWAEPVVAPPISHAPIDKDTEIRRIAGAISRNGNFGETEKPVGLPKQKSADRAPGYVGKAPVPLRLGNVGQVKAIAAAFDVSSAPNSPLSKAAPHLLQAGLTVTTPEKPSSPLALPKRAAQKSLWTSSSSGSDRHYDTPASSGSGSRQQYASQFRAAGKISSYVNTKIPTKSSGLTPPKIEKSLSPSPTPSSRRQSQSPYYETLTLPGRYGSPQQFLNTPEPMDKSSTPESMDSANSGGIIARQTDMRRKQFLYGKPSVPTSKVQTKPCSPVGKSGISKLEALKPASVVAAPKVQLRQTKPDQSAKSRVTSLTATETPPVEKKRSSWIMKFRAKK